MKISLLQNVNFRTSPEIALFMVLIMLQFIETIWKIFHFTLNYSTIHRISLGE